MKRRIITFGRYFGEFMEGLTAKEREKVDYGLVLLKTQDRLPAKFVKHIRDGLYELRTEYNGNIYTLSKSSLKVLISLQLTPKRALLLQIHCVQFCVRTLIQY